MPPGWDPRRPPDPDDAGPVLYLPDDSDPDAQLVVSPEPIDPATHAAADRWAAYHGATRERSWALLSVESVRTRDDVLDGDAVVGPNPLTPAEPGILRALNADRPRLARLCARAGVHPASPLAVGVDPDGLDVRASLGVVRVEFDGECPDGPAVERALTDLALPP